MGHMYGDKDLGKLIGYVNVFIGIGGAIGATAVGMLMQHYGSYQMPWLYMAAVLLIVAVIRGICTSNKRKFRARKHRGKQQAREDASCRPGLAVRRL